MKHTSAPRHGKGDGRKGNYNNNNPRRDNPHKKFPTTHVVEGSISVSAKGVGYVEVEGMKEDIEIDPRDLGTTLNRDRVKIVLHAKRAGECESGEVTEILFRNKTKFVGILEEEGGNR